MTQMFYVHAEVVIPVIATSLDDAIDSAEEMLDKMDTQGVLRDIRCHEVEEGEVLCGN